MAELKRVLSYPVLLLIVINSILGTGIFFLPAMGAKIAGPASIISWLVLSVISIYMAMVFGELASMFPEAGGVYEFCKNAFGRFPSFLIGWLTLVGGNITIAMLMVGAIRYLLPFQITTPIIVVSIILILAFNIVAYRGMKISATMLVVFAFITLAALASLIVPGFIHFNPENFSPFFPLGTGVVFLAIFAIAETFFGWESPTFLAGETKDGRKTVPKALVHGTIIIALISLVFVVVSIGSYGWKAFGMAEAPLSALAAFFYGSRITDAFSLLVYLAIIGSVADWVVSAPRLILSMAKDKLFLHQFAKIHPIFATPYKAIIFQAVVSSILIVIGAGSYLTLLHILVPILLILYGAVLTSVVVLRYKKPHHVRYMKAPFGRTGPILVMFFFIALLVVWLKEAPDAIGSVMLGLSLFLIGIPLYFLLEMYHDPKAIRIVNDMLANLTLAVERLTLPMGVRKEIISLLGNIKGKVVLEFGCSVGTLTLHLAEEVGKSGRVYATDIAKHEVDIASRRLEKKGLHHVTVIHDEQHATRVHPDVPDVHVAVSVGMLGYVQNVKSVLRGINRRLKTGSRICFVDYDKFFEVIPNIDWLSDKKKIKRIFHDAGFTVEVKHRRGLAWKYIFIFGTKFKNVR